MPPISTSDPVFLGVIRHPKTWVPIYVVRQAGTQRSVSIVGRKASKYVSFGEGYLNDDQEYAGATEVTGLPRSHTPSGVVEKGGGYGTCLYTALVLLASAQADKEIVVPRLIGHGRGICSAEGTRSPSASAWWAAAMERGLTDQQEGETEGSDDSSTETETEDQADIENVVSSRAWRKLTAAVEEAISDAGSWSISGGLSITCDIEREIESEESSRGGEQITADVYTLESAEKARLIAVRETVIGDVLQWGRKSPLENGFNADHGKIIVALNVAGEDSLLVAKLALIARSHGASEVQITDMMMRNRFGVDVVSRRVLFERGEQVDIPFPQSRPAIMGGNRRHRLPPPRESVDPRGSTDPVRNPSAWPLRRNPSPTPSRSEETAIGYSIERLERLRADLDVNNLEDLP